MEIKKFTVDRSLMCDDHCVRYIWIRTIRTKIMLNADHLAKERLEIKLKQSI